MSVMPMILPALTLVAANAPIEGRWTNPGGSVTIAIASCGAALCGTVVAASDGAKADAARGGTANLIGAQLLTGFTAIGPTRWKGRLFVPDINKRPRATLQLTSPRQLKVSGCMVGRVVCRSQMWTRAD